MKFALVRRRAGEDTALHSTAVSTGPIYPPLRNYVGGKGIFIDFTTFFTLIHLK